MSAEEQSPFVPGARVAVHDRYADGYTPGKVAKVYKTGKFILEGSTQQWKPYRHGWGDGTRAWCATETGDSWRHGSLKIWDASTDAEIRTALADKARKDRWYALRKRVEAMHHDNVTDAMCDALEALLPPKETKVTP